MPLPRSTSISGLSGASLVIVTPPARKPTAVGAKLTASVQLLLASNVAMQLVY